MSKVEEFLKENMMLSSSFNREEMKQTFQNDMLTKQTLGMFKTYLSVKKEDQPLDKVLAIDAGGTNLRFAFFEDGEKVLEKKMPMFGVKEPITESEFFDTVV